MFSRKDIKQSKHKSSEFQLQLIELSEFIGKIKRVLITPVNGFHVK